MVGAALNTLYPTYSGHVFGRLLSVLSRMVALKAALSHTSISLKNFGPKVIFSQRDGRCRFTITLSSTDFVVGLLSSMIADHGTKSSLLLPYPQDTEDIPKVFLLDRERQLRIDQCKEPSIVIILANWKKKKVYICINKKNEQILNKVNNLLRPIGYM